MSLVNRRRLDLTPAEALRELRGAEYLARVKIDRLELRFSQPREAWQQQTIDDAKEAHAVVKKALDRAQAETSR